MRKSQKEKKLQTRTLHHKGEIAYEWQRKDLEGERGRRMACRGRSGWLASNSCKCIAQNELTVNKYYLLYTIRMILGSKLQIRGEIVAQGTLTGKWHFFLLGSERWVLGFS